MQSYKPLVVSEHLADRYPYLEPEFMDRYNPSEVFHAVFDRSIPKLVEIMQMPDLPPENYRDALITLNEMVSHQENKAMMIEAGLVEVASEFMDFRVREIRREAVNLLGSLVSLAMGREKTTETTFKNLESLLLEECTEIREAAGWALVRLCSGRDGVDLLCSHQSFLSIIQAFLIYSNFDERSGKFLVYLLSAGKCFLQYNNGIQFFLGQGFLERVKVLLDHQEKEMMRIFGSRLNSLLLACVSLVSVNWDGKRESVEVGLISTANDFLISENEEEVHYAVTFLLNASLLLEGKDEIVDFHDDEILKRIIFLLDREDEILHKNCMQTLMNCSDLKRGFVKMTKYLFSNIKFLDELFGSKALVALCELLPPTPKLESPPFHPEDKVKEFQSICQGIAYFLKKDDEAVVIAIEETNKIVEKLVPFLIFRDDKPMQSSVASCLYKLCYTDEFSRNTLRKYFELYGDVFHSGLNTTLNTELNKHSKLFEIIHKY